MKVKRAAAVMIATTSAIVIAILSAPAGAQETDRTDRVNGSTALAQAQSKYQRVRPHIRVTPLYPYRTETLPYPPPYDIEYPGPGFVRQCNSWLAPEYRPSGTVIVQHSRCWWQRGAAR